MTENNAKIKIAATVLVAAIQGNKLINPPKTTEKNITLIFPINDAFFFFSSVFFVIKTTMIMPIIEYTQKNNIVSKSKYVNLSKIFI